MARLRRVEPLLQANRSFLPSTSITQMKSLWDETQAVASAEFFTRPVCSIIRATTTKVSTTMDMMLTKNVIEAGGLCWYNHNRTTVFNPGAFRILWGRVLVQTDQTTGKQTLADGYEW